MFKTGHCSFVIQFYLEIYIYIYVSRVRCYVLVEIKIQSVDIAKFDIAGDRYEYVELHDVNTKNKHSGQNNYYVELPDLSKHTISNHVFPL